MSVRTQLASARARLTESLDGKIPAVAVIFVYCVLLFAIPSRLVVKPIGAAGTPANLWGLFALLWWLCATIGNQKPLRRPSPVRLAVGVVTVAVLLAYAAGMTRGWYAPSNVQERTNDLIDLVPVTAQRLRAAMMLAADRGLLSFGAWLGITLLVLDGLRSRADLDRIIRWITTLVGLVALLGIVQYFTGISIDKYFQIPGLVANQDFGTIASRSILRRVYSTANHPIEFGVVMAAVFPLALHRVLYSRQSKAAWFATITIGVAVPLSLSRSAILVLIAALGTMFIGWPPSWRRRFVQLIPVVIVAVRVALPGVVGTIISLFKNLGADPSVSGRTNDYDVAFRVYSHNPWFGQGTFTFIPRFYRILDNQLLVFLIELGLFGFLAVVAMVIVAFCCARGSRRRATDAEHRHLGLALSASVAGVSISYATFDAWSFPMAAGLTFLLVALSGAAWSLSDRPEISTPAESSTATRDMSTIGA